MSRSAIAPASRLTGGYTLRGRYRTVVETAATTIVAARTTTAGHLLAFRWAPATAGVNCYLRYVAARFVLTTAYTTAQETGCDLVIARAYSIAHTGGTAVDTGGTITSTGERFTAQPVSLVNDLRAGTTGALTAGTQVLDAKPVASISDWSTAIGSMVPSATRPQGPDGGVLWDSRATHDHIQFTTSEGFVIRNLVLMGAVGVGNWYFTIEHDEGIPDGETNVVPQG